MRRALFALVVSAALPAADACAAPLLQTLPADGAWASYYVTIKVEGQPEQSPLWTIRSVGGKTVDGRKCRWIEMDGSREQDGKSITYVVYKLLIPEKAFGKGKNPFKQVKQAWVKTLGEDPRQIEDLQRNDPYLNLILSGPVKGVKQLKKKQPVDWQKGRLQCRVLTGSSSFDNKVLQVQLTHRVLLHDEVPFGIAGCNFDLAGKLGNRKLTARVEVTLKAFGNKAKSALPDVK